MKPAAALTDALQHQRRRDEMRLWSEIGAHYLELMPPMVRQILKDYGLTSGTDPFAPFPSMLTTRWTRNEKRPGPLEREPGPAPPGRYGHTTQRRAT